MSGDAFDRLEQGLRGAVRAGVAQASATPASAEAAGRRRSSWRPGARPRPRWGGHLSRRGGLLAIGAALVLGGGALAATQVLEVGAPAPEAPLPKPRPTVGAGVATGKPQILPLRVSDPYGGPSWALRTFTSSRGGSCVQVGQVLDGRFGRVLPGAGGRLQLRPISATPGANSLCGFVERNGYPVLRGLRTVEVTGGMGDRRRCGGNPCPITAVRTIRYGLLGPAARSATYVDGAGHDGATMRVDGARGGAYLFVVRTDPAPYVEQERAQRATSEALRRELARLRGTGLSERELMVKAMAGARRTTRRMPRGGRPQPIRDGVRATFTGGTVLRVAGAGRWPGALPGVTRVTPSPVAVRAPLRVTHRGAAARATYTVRFRAPVAIRRGDHHYTFTIAGHGGRDCSARSGRGGGWATTRDIAAGELVSFVAWPSFGGKRSTWCPGRYVLRVGYRTGSGPFRGRLVGSSAFTVPRNR
jgi:hypothetical protein